MTLTNFRKHINNYSYTILSWIIGGLLFGFDQAIIIAFCGLAIDTALIIKNRGKIPKDIKRKDPFSKMFSVWGYTAFGFSFGYLLIIWLGTNQENNGIMDYWIIFFQPLTDKVSHYLPAVGNYVQQLNFLGQEWRIARVTHLVAILWTANIIFSILLPVVLLQFDWQRPLTVFYRAVSINTEHSFYVTWIKQYVLRILAFFVGSVVSGVFFYTSFYGLTIWANTSRKLEFLVVVFLLAGFWLLLLVTIMFITLIRIHYNSHIKPITRLIRNKFLLNKRSVF